MKSNILEVIVNKVSDTKITNASDVDQIEYCINLENGGLTPSFKDVESITKLSNKKVRVIIRNHYDNFLITDIQLLKIINFIKQTNHLNIDGYVFGAITKDNEVDYNALEKVISVLNGKSLTFHKAFDFVENKQYHLKKLLKYPQLKFILTSGGPGNPLDNLDFFNNVDPILKHKILIGGQVNFEVINVLKQKGFVNFHIGKAARNSNDYISELNLDIIQGYKKVVDS